MAAARSSASSAGDKSTLRMVLFFACILACIGCMYLLIDFQTGLKPKLSGELILGQVDTVSYQHQDAPLRNFLFEYFGLLSYLLAAMIVYVGYFVCLKPTDIWHIDFYKTSLRILGFNFLFLGGAALLSRYSDLINTGAGGLLGDMLNMFCDLFLPHVVSVFIFAFLAFSGLTFLLGSSPNRVFERVVAAQIASLSAWVQASLRSYHQNQSRTKPSLLKQPKQIKLFKQPRANLTLLTLTLPPPSPQQQPPLLLPQPPLHQPVPQSAWLHLSPWVLWALWKHQTQLLQSFL